MFRKRFVCLAAALYMLLSAGAVSAVEVECDDVYCFVPEDFGEFLSGICITDLPDTDAGTVMLGSRVIREGDILTTQQLLDMTFCPLLTEADCSAAATYLPIHEDHVAAAATMSIAGTHINIFAIEPFPFHGLYQPAAAALEILTNDLGPTTSSFSAQAY